jgi:hypothetical protein
MMSEEHYRDGPTPEAERQGDFVEVTVIADDQSSATVKRNRRHDPIMSLYERGAITEEQHDAAVEIARIAEEITRPVGLRCASLEARVDNSGSARNLLIENLSRVQLEATYNRWRDRLPMPRRMVIDMVVDHRPIDATARIYNIGFRKARARLIHSLDRWIDIRSKMRELIDAQDVEAAQLRVGGGSVT